MSNPYIVKYSRSGKPVDSAGFHTVDFEFVNCNEFEREILCEIIIEAADNIDFDDTEFYFTEECENLASEIKSILNDRNLDFKCEVVYFDDNYRTNIKKIRFI